MFFNYKSILVNIQRTENPIQLKGIEGNTIEVEEEADLLGYGTVYCHPKVTANVMSFFNMARRFKSVVYNSQDQDAFLVTRNDGSIIKVAPLPEGLYYYDFKNSIERQQGKIQKTLVVNSVEELRRNYTGRELQKVKAARRLYMMMGRPSKDDFQPMLRKGKLLNNPVTMMDYNYTERIYGKDLGVVKGKTIQTRPLHVSVDTESAAKEKLNIVLSVDIMHFIGLTFLVTVSQNIRFITAMILSDRKKKMRWNK